MGDRPEVIGDATSEHVPGVPAGVLPVLTQAAESASAAPAAPEFSAAHAHSLPAPPSPCAVSSQAAPPDDSPAWEAPKCSVCLQGVGFVQGRFCCPPSSPSHWSHVGCLHDAWALDSRCPVCRCEHSLIPPLVFEGGSASGIPALPPDRRRVAREGRSPSRSPSGGRLQSVRQIPVIPQAAWLDDGFPAPAPEPISAPEAPGATRQPSPRSPSGSPGGLSFSDSFSGRAPAVRAHIPRGFGQVLQRPALRFPSHASRPSHHVSVHALPHRLNLGHPSARSPSPPCTSPRSQILRSMPVGGPLPPAPWHAPSPRSLSMPCLTHAAPPRPPPFLRPTPKSLLRPSPSLLATDTPQSPAPSSVAPPLARAFAKAPAGLFARPHAPRGALPASERATSAGQEGSRHAHLVSRCCDFVLGSLKASTLGQGALQSRNPQAHVARVFQMSRAGTLQRHVSAWAHWEAWSEPLGVSVCEPTLGDVLDFLFDSLHALRADRRCNRPRTDVRSLVSGMRFMAARVGLPSMEDLLQNPAVFAYSRNVSSTRDRREAPPSRLRQSSPWSVVCGIPLAPPPRSLPWAVSLPAFGAAFVLGMHSGAIPAS